jgi:bifunctional ADP-heptose synthase (sugar kinase/adenylyltransferase)
LDTRNKILESAAAAETVQRLRSGGERVTAVVGSFDVLQADHVRDLARVRNETGSSKVVAVLVTGEAALLAPRARAEMAAGLAVIDYVVPVEGGGLEALLAGFDPACVIRAEALHHRLTRRLMEHVRERQTVVRQ